MGPLVLLLLIVLILFLISLMCFYVYLRIIKAQRFRKEEEMERLKKQIRPFVSAALEGNDQGDPVLLDAGTEAAQSALQDVLLEFMKWMNDEDTVAVINNLASLKLAEPYRKQLRSRKVSARLNAMYFIENFHLTELEPDVLALYRENRNRAELNPQASRTLAALQSGTFMKLFFHEDSSEAGYLYKEVIRRLDDVVYSQWMETLVVHPNRKIRSAVLAVAAQKGDWSAIPLFEKAAVDDELEVRLQAYKGFEKLGVVPDMIIPADIAASEYWPERMMAARLWRVAHSRGIQEFIRELIKDSSWWVRYYAGEALSCHPNGEEELLFIHNTSEDPFARDMAGQWLDAMKGEVV